MADVWRQEMGGGVGCQSTRYSMPEASEPQGGQDREDSSEKRRPEKVGVMRVEVLDWAMNWEDDRRLLGKEGQ